MPQNALGTNELYLVVALIGCFALCWGILFLSLRGRDEIMKVLLSEGNLLRMIAVGFIIASVGTLCLVGKLSGEVASAILSGVAGYVLGGIPKKSD